MSTEGDNNFDDGTGGGTGEGGTTSMPRPTRKPFLYGVPLNTVKHAKFISKAGTFYNFAKLVFNNAVYDTHRVLENGAVVFGDNYATWIFVAPNDHFDKELVYAGTFGEGLEHIASVTAEKPLSAWDDFIDFLNSFSVNLDQVFSQIHRAFLISLDDSMNLTSNEGINFDDFLEFEVSLPNFSNCKNFSDFAYSIRNAVDNVADRPAKYYIADDGSFAFIIGVTQLGDDGVEKLGAGLVFIFRE